MSDELVTNLTEALNYARDRFQKGLPSDILAILDLATDSLTKSGILDRCLKVGDSVPNFTLPNVSDRPIALQDFLAKGPAVISFYRGIWCPFCGLELQALQEMLPTIQALGASLIVISPQSSLYTHMTAGKYGLTFEVLSDQGNQVAHQFGLVYQVPEPLRPFIEAVDLHLPTYNGDESFSLPIPGTFVVDRQGTVLYAFVDPDYTYRLDPFKIVSILRKHS